MEDEPLPPGVEAPSGCALPPPPPPPRSRPEYTNTYNPGYGGGHRYRGGGGYGGIPERGSPPFGRDGLTPGALDVSINSDARKRSYEDQPGHAQGPIKRHRLLHPATFVIAGGTSGAGFCYELKEALGRLGHATEVTKWAGHYSAHMNANVALLEKCATEAANVSEDAAVVIVGNSFGCRVVAEFLARRGDPKRAAKAAPLHPNIVADGAVLASFPLYGPAAPRDAKGDRREVLTRIPATAKLLFVSGEKDEFLDRTQGGTAWRRETAPRGVAALRAVAADLPCAENVTVVGIENTGHNALKAGRKKVEPAKELMLRALAPFVEAFHGVDVPLDTRLDPGDGESSDDGKDAAAPQKRRGPRGRGMGQSDGRVADDHHVNNAVRERVIGRSRGSATRDDHRATRGDYADYRYDSGPL